MEGSISGEMDLFDVAFGAACIVLGWLLATIQYHRRSPGEKRLDRYIEEAGKKLLDRDRDHAAVHAAECERDIEEAGERLLAADLASVPEPGRMECQECGTQYIHDGDRIVTYTDYKAGTPVNGFCNFSCGAAAGGRGDPY